MLDAVVKIYDVSRLAELWQRLWCKILSSIAEIFDGTAKDAELPLRCMQLAAR